MSGPSLRLSAQRRRAITILAEHGPLLPNAFARRMWPAAPGWHHHTRCGRTGVSPGGGMVFAAGGYLGRLCQQGWIERTYRRDSTDALKYIGYGLTPAGRAALGALDTPAQPAGHGRDNHATVPRV